MLMIIYNIPKDLISSLLRCLFIQVIAINTHK